MVKDEIVIIDKTLSVLWNKYCEKLSNNISLVAKLANLLVSIGSSYIELDVELYKRVYKLDNNGIFIIGKSEKLIIEKSINTKEQLEKYKNSYNRISGLGDLLFYDYKSVFIEIKNRFGQDVEVEIVNEFGLGTAISNEWINSGGTTIVASFAGIGGYTPLEEIICVNKFIEKRLYRSETKVLPEIIKIIESITDEMINDKKPILGEKIFHVESGIHVDGIIKNSSNYEPYPPIEVGRSRKIIIGKYSGEKAFKFKLKELNIQIDISKFETVFKAIKNESIRKSRSLYDSEIYEICKDVNLV